MSLHGPLAALVLLSASGAAHGAILTGASDPACRQAAAYSESRGGASLLMLRDGEVVCEAYAAQGGPERRLELASGTKSFVGVIAAAAVQDRLLSLDEPVSKTLAEWRDGADRQKVTLRQVLSLTLGMPSQVGRPPEYAAAVGYPLNAAPGARFQYGPAPFQLFGEVMKRKLTAAGQSPDPVDYLRRRVLSPIGLAEVGWRRTPGGDPLLPQGAQLTAREWATFGEFVRAGGVWKGRALVDPVAFQQMFEGSTANPAYGLTWWLPVRSGSSDAVTATWNVSRDPGCVPEDLVAALGAGNQRLFVIPSLRMTVVRQAELGDLLARAAGRRESSSPSSDSQHWSDRQFLLDTGVIRPKCVP